MADERMTKNQRREEARLAALRMKEEQARKSRRQRNLAIVLSAVGAVVLGGVIWLIFSLGNQPLLESVELRPAGSTLSGAIPVGKDGVAGVTDGAAEDAVRVAVYSDFMCPICSSFEEINGETLADLRESGDIILEYHPVAILDRASQGTAYSTRSATAAALVADQSPEAFVDFVDVLFANQPEEGTTGLTDPEIADLADEAGVAAAVVEQIRTGAYLGTGEDDPTTFRPWVVAATAQGSKDLGRLGTPTVVIDGEKLDTKTYNWTEEGVLAQAIEDARG